MRTWERMAISASTLLAWQCHAVLLGKAHHAIIEKSVVLLLVLFWRRGGETLLCDVDLPIMSKAIAPVQVGDKDRGVDAGRRSSHDTSSSASGTWTLPVHVNSTEECPCGCDVCMGEMVVHSVNLSEPGSYTRTRWMWGEGLSLLMGIQIQRFQVAHFPYPASSPRQRLLKPRERVCLKKH